MAQDRLAREWDSFCRAAFPPGLSKQQMTDLKRTFFAGAKGFINLVEGSDPSMSEEQLLSEVQIELLTFVEDVKAGRA